MTYLFHACLRFLGLYCVNRSVTKKKKIVHSIIYAKTSYFYFFKYSYLPSIFTIFMQLQQLKFLHREIKTTEKQLPYKHKVIIKEKEQ